MNDFPFLGAQGSIGLLIAVGKKLSHPQNNILSTKIYDYSGFIIQATLQKSSSSINEAIVVWTLRVSMFSIGVDNKLIYKPH